MNRYELILRSDDGEVLLQASISAEIVDVGIRYDEESLDLSVCDEYPRSIVMLLLETFLELMSEVDE